MLLSTGRVHTACAAAVGCKRPCSGWVGITEDKSLNSRSAVFYVFVFLVFLTIYPKKMEKPQFSIPDALPSVKLAT